MKHDWLLGLPLLLLAVFCVALSPAEIKGLAMPIAACAALLYVAIAGFARSRRLAGKFRGKR